MSHQTTAKADFLENTQPRGELAARSLAMPGDTNPAGNIFGGWIMSLMDAAGSMTASQYSGCRVVTAAVTHMSFLEPVKSGDSVCCYTEILNVRRTSMTLAVEVWVRRQGCEGRRKVTAAEFTFVAIDEGGRPRPISTRRIVLGDAPTEPEPSEGGAS